MVSCSALHKPSRKNGTFSPILSCVRSVSQSLQLSHVNFNINCVSKWKAGDCWCAMQIHTYMVCKKSVYPMNIVFALYIIIIHNLCVYIYIRIHIHLFRIPTLPRPSRPQLLCKDNCDASAAVSTFDNDTSYIITRLSAFSVLLHCCLVP